MAGRSETARCAVRPDLKTIADFHRDDVAVFYAVFRQFNLTDRDLGVFGGEVTAIDGITLKAINNGVQLGDREVARLAGMASTRGSRRTFSCRMRTTARNFRWPTVHPRIHRPYVTKQAAPSRARKRPTRVSLTAPDSQREAFGRLSGRPPKSGIASWNGRDVWLGFVTSWVGLLLSPRVMAYPPLCLGWRR